MTVVGVAVAVVLSAVLSACAPVVPTGDGPARAEFRISGTVVARPDNAPARRANFRWTRVRLPDGQHADHATFTRHGAVVARMDIAPDGVVVQTSGGRFEGENLAARHLGFAVPLRAFGFWLAGQPVPGVHSRETVGSGADGAGGIVRIRQLGWDVRFVSRDDDGFPTRIEADFPGGSAVVTVRSEGLQQ